MKNQLLIVCTLLLSLMGSIGNAQDYNRSINTEDYTHVPTYQYPNSNEEYCLRVYIYSIEKPGGIGGVDDEILSTRVNSLNNYFSDTGIQFIWEDETIHRITDIYDNDIIITNSDGDQIGANFNLLESYVDPSLPIGINLFFHGRNLGSSWAQGIASHNANILMSAQHANTAVLIHEMGHILGLFHTHHGQGVEGEDGNDPVDFDCPGFSGDDNIAGDYVEDTTTTHGTFTFNGLDNCFAMHETELINCPNGMTGTYEDFIINNPMVIKELPGSPQEIAILINCYENGAFTPGQVQRMKYFINPPSGTNVPELDIHNAIVDCPIPLNPCENCQGAANNADALFNSIPQSTTDPSCLMYPVSLPLVTCDDTYIITYPGGELTLSSMNTSGYLIFNELGDNQLIEIVVIRDGICIEEEYFFDVDCDNDPPTCLDCIVTGNTIVDSLEVTLGSSDACTTYKITVPEIDPCYTGIMSWGDGTVENLVSGEMMFHSYINEGTFTGFVSLNDENGNTCFKSSDFKIEVSCPNECRKPCDITPEFTYTSNNCTYNFDGENIANDCPSFIYDYEWKVNGILVGTSENLSFEFDAAGFYTVEYTISYNDGVRQCEEKTTEIIYVSCVPNQCFTPDDIHYINEGDGGICTNGLVNLTGINSSEVSNVEWTWALATFAGTGVSNSLVSAIYYPPGDWTGYNISICATVTLTDGSTCATVCNSFTLDCDSTPDKTIKEQAINAFPNPFVNQFTLESKDLNVYIKQVEIYNTYGTLIKRQAYSNGETITVDRGAPGLYFAKVYLEDGTIETLQLIKK